MRVNPPCSHPPNGQVIFDRSYTTSHNRTKRETTMRLSEVFLPEFDQEMTTARKTLERIPEDKLTWKPHEKSMPLGRLAGHIAELAGWPAPTIEQESLDFRP